MSLPSVSEDIAFNRSRNVTCFGRLTDLLPLSMVSAIDLRPLNRCQPGPLMYDRGTSFSFLLAGNPENVNNATFPHNLVMHRS